MGLSQSEVKLLITAQGNIESVVNSANAALGRLASTAQGATSPMQQFAAAAAVSGARAAALAAAAAPAAQQLNNLGNAARQASSAAQSSGLGFGQMAGAMTLGSVAANAITGAISNIAGAMANAGGATLALASRLEQARIGFTKMLGSVEKADQFIGQLQAKAESTAFNFPGLQQVAQSFLAMGISAQNVIPIIDDVSNALSAAGHGGDTEALQRVGASLSEIAAQGKITAEQIRELSRNGIAVLPLLAEAFGKTTAEVRKMAEAGEITAEKFFAAFHSEVALHYGDIQAEQARTWAVAASNVSDIVGRLATTTFKELTDALTQGALALNEFLHSDRVLQWAADFKASIHDVITALQPLGAAMRAAMGLAPGGSAPTAKPALAGKGPPEEGTRGMIVPPAAIASAKDYAGAIAAGTANIHTLTAALTGLSEQQNAIKNQISDIQAGYKAQLDGLKAQQDAINASIEATKEKWAAVIEPLEATQAALKRLAEDTKTAFANILDPLKSQLESVTQDISDIKVAYERIVTPIERQIAAIDKATAALTKQREILGKIADIRLRQQQLDALGDPQLRASIASQLKALEISADYLNIQKDQLDLGNKKGNNDKAIANVQKQLDANRSKELALQKQLLDAADKPLQAQIAGQEVLNKAKADQLAIDKDTADVNGQKEKAPLEAQLEAAKLQLQRFLDPLEAQAHALTNLIQDVSKSEADALKPIIAAQTSVARQIEDANAAMAAALAPLEAAAKAVAAQIKEVEAAERAELAPIQAKLDALERESADLEIQKKQIADKIAAWKDEEKAIKDATAAAAAHTAALDLSGGATPAGAADPKVGTSFITPEQIESIKAFGEAIATADTNVKNLDASMKEFSGGGLGDVIKGFALLVAANVVVGMLASMLASLTAIAASPVTGTLIAIGAQFVALALPIKVIQGYWDKLVLAWNTPGTYAEIDAIRKKWDELVKFFQEFNWATFGAGIAKVFTDMGDNIGKAATLMLKDSREGGSNPFPAIGAWFSEFPGKVGAAKDLVIGVFTGMGANIKAAADLMLKATSQGGSNPFPDLQASISGFLDSVKPVIASIVTAFNPLAEVLKTIGDAMAKMPTDIPGWLGGLIALIRGGGGGGGTQNTRFSSGGISGPGNPNAAPGEIEAYIRQAAILRGIDDNIAILVAQSEGGLNDPTRQSDYMYKGVREQSYGPFQLNIQGGLGSSALAQGIDPRDPAMWKAAIDYALNQAAAGGWGPWHGAAAAGIGDWQGIGAGASQQAISPPSGLDLVSMKATLPIQAQLTAGTELLTQAQEVAAQADAAAAKARDDLNRIMSGSPATINAVTAAQQGAAVQGQAFTSVLSQLYNDVANGRTPLNTLQLQLVAIAAKAGENGAAGELSALTSGTESGAQALENYATLLGMTNPEIERLAIGYRAAGGAAKASQADTAKFALDLLNVQKAAQAVAQSLGGAIGNAGVDVIKAAGGGQDKKKNGEGSPAGGGGLAGQGAAWAAMWQQMDEAVTQFWAAFNKVEPKREEAWAASFSAFTTGLAGSWQGAWDSMGAATAAFWDAWIKGEPKIEAGILEAWTAFTTSIGSAWTAAFANVGTGTWADDFAASIKTVQDAWDGLGQILAQANIGQAVEQAFNGIPAATQPAVQAIKDVQSAVEQLYEYVSSHPIQIRIQVPTMPNFPSFDVGGVVPGPVGAPQLAIVHGVERILTPGQSRSVLSNASSRAVLSGEIGGGTTVVQVSAPIHVHGGVLDQGKIQEIVATAWTGAVRSGRLKK